MQKDNRKMVFYKQGSMGKWDCFAVALMNFQVYNSYPLNTLKLSLLCDWNKGAVDTGKVINQLGLPLEPTTVLNKVIRNSGIITIEHPLYGLHSAFVFKKDKKIYMVNSLLGNLVECVKKSQLLKLLPKDKRQDELWSG